MGRELFGTDGVRGLAGEYPLNEVGAVAIGRAVGTQFAAGGEQIAIACDTRESSDLLVEQIAAGLQQVGVHAVFVGVMPTPGLAYVTKLHPEFVAGIMITASHNTYEYNGVKVFSGDGGKLPDDAEERLNTDIEQGVPDRGTGSFDRVDYVDEYESYLVASADNLRLHGMRIAVDSANGAASGVATRVFAYLGAEVVPLGDEPNGHNINVDCGATNTTALRETVLGERCQLGIAVDGDADRLMMVDENGRECTGDHLLYLLAVGNEYTTVVATVMTNLGAEQAMNNRGITLERTAVGDRYVLERLLENGARLGGEQSGHIIMPDLSTTGDGLLAAIQVLRVLQDTATALADWYDEVHLLPQALVNFRIDDKSKLAAEDVRAYVAEQTELLGTQGRVLVRPSGTEPLARVMVEAPDAQNLAEQIAAKLQELVA